MTLLSANRDAREIQGRGLPLNLNVIASDIIYAGGMGAVDYTGEIQPASDTVGLRVVGRIPAMKDNTADGEVSNIEHGIFRYENSSSYPVTRACIGKTCYVEDDATVAAGSTCLVAAGIVYDVDADGVWVDQTAAALVVARMNARIYIRAITGTTDSPTAAECFQGNVLLTASNSGATTISLPTAIAGYRVGVQRITATSGYDVTIHPYSGDRINSGAVNGNAVNTTDAVSDALWLETQDATYWKNAPPLAKDRAVWATT